MSNQPIHTDKAPAALGPYSQAISANFAFKGTVVFCSGQIGLDPVTGNMKEGFEAQVDQAFANMQAVIKAAGADLSGVVKLTLFLTDLSNFATVNAKMEALFQKPYPARSTVGVSALPKGALFEVEAIVTL
ncbi:MAG: RidA family protein [Burkholderiales bacterium]|nr:MAG: RidA family protein [Betaproteobacteria bacterium]TAG46220.1 MAG: RidA family protein [Betaproteobacteria bacterium]TAG69682.1 MAG: RidA family protein [Burkholderiales bacterium]